MPGVIGVDRITWQVNRQAVPGPARLTAPLDPKIHSRGRVVTTLKADRPTRVQLPVLYYPRLLEVRDNGNPIAYGNVGRFVALELSPGPHRIDVRFAGVGWANLLTVVGIGLLVGWMTVLPLWCRWRKTPR